MSYLTFRKVREPYQKPYELKVAIEVPDKPDDWDPALDQMALAALEGVETLTYAWVQHGYDTVTLRFPEESSFTENLDPADVTTWLFGVFRPSVSTTVPRLSMTATYEKALERLVTDEHMDTYDAVDPHGLFMLVRGSGTWA